MRNMTSAILLSCVVTLGASHVISGGSALGVPPTVTPTVLGVAAAGNPIDGTVSLKDSSVPPRLLTTRTKGDGSFSFDVNGLTKPFLLKVEWTEGAMKRSLFSLNAGSDTANINPLSNVAVAGAAKTIDPSLLFLSDDPAAFRRAAADFPAVIDSLMAMLSPLFQQYSAAQNPVTDLVYADHTGLDALFDDVSIVLSGGNIIMFNKATKGRIFSSRAADIPSGQFVEANMPFPGMLRTKTKS